MNVMAKLFRKTRRVIATERNLDGRLNDLEDAAVTTEQGATPEPGQILLFTSIIRATLEESRRFWQKLTIALSVVAVGLLALLILK